MGVLAVDIDQQFPELAAVLERAGIAVDEGAGPALAGDDAPQDALVAGIQVPVGQPAPGGWDIGDVEGGGDLGAVAARTHRGRVGAIAQAEPQRVQHDGLAGAGLAGDDGHAAGELQVELRDDRVVPDLDVGEHGHLIPQFPGHGNSPLAGDGFFFGAIAKIPRMSQQELSDRARILLKTLIERHIRDGQPVGSQTLLEEAGLPVSAATVRNVMSDLEERGYLASPHTSAGRVPTSAGYRLFVDTLLQVQPIDHNAVATLREELNPDKPGRELVQSASQLVSAITAQAGLVTVPRQNASQLRQVEFLPLDGNRVLVIMVINEREVQNRIIHTERPYGEEELHLATAMMNQRFAGARLEDIKRQILAEMEADRQSIDTYMQATMELASKVFEDDEDEQEDYLVAGESRLVGGASPEELERLQELFEAFQRKKDLLHLLERCTRAEGIQIFIGDEAGFEALGGFSVVTAPYTDGAEVLGVLGVIGPTRMAYERVIPIVDVTARLLSSALSSAD